MRPIGRSRNVVRMSAATLVPEYCSSGDCGAFCRWSHVISSAADQRYRRPQVMPPLHEWRGFVALSGHRFSTLNRKLGTETFSLCPRRMAQIGQQEEDREP